MRSVTKAALAVCAALPLLSSCAQQPRQAAAPDAYMVGADPRDDACSRVVGAFGFAAAVLGPEGEEEAQDFGAAVRGRLAYVQGVLLQYGSRLPQGVRGEEAVLRRTTRSLSPAATPHEEQIRLLKDYRRAVVSVERACARDDAGGR